MSRPIPLERPRLAEGWQLVFEDGCALVRRGLDNADVAALGGGEAVLLGLMDGERRHDELRQLMRDALGRCR